MSESVIIHTPLLLILYGLALALNLFDLVKRTGFLLPVLSAFIAVGASALALLSGASLYETGTVLLIFILVNLQPLRRKKK